MLRREANFGHKCMKFVLVHGSKPTRLTRIAGHPKIWRPQRIAGIYPVPAPSAVAPPRRGYNSPAAPAGVRAAIALVGSVPRPGEFGMDGEASCPNSLAGAVIAPRDHPARLDGQPMGQRPNGLSSIVTWRSDPVRPRGRPVPRPRRDPSGAVEIEARVRAVPLRQLASGCLCCRSPVPRLSWLERDPQGTSPGWLDAARAQGLWLRRAQPARQGADHYDWYRDFITTLLNGGTNLVRAGHHVRRESGGPRLIRALTASRPSSGVMNMSSCCGLGLHQPVMFTLASGDPRVEVAGYYAMTESAADARDAVGPAHCRTRHVCRFAAAAKGLTDPNRPGAEGCGNGATARHKRGRTAPVSLCVRFGGFSPPRCKTAAASIGPPRRPCRGRRGSRTQIRAACPA